MSLTVRNATLAYPARHGAAVEAFRDVSLTIGDDELVTCVGASGCGKSSLLAAIAGFQPLTAGTITDDATPVTGPSPTRGVVFQRDTLFPWATARDNVAFGLRLAGMSRPARRARAEELLAAVGLPDIGRRYPWQLSGGMRQRVGLARAIATSPRLLLMDEPLGALDSFTREAMQELVARLWARECRRILFVTHSIEEALFLGTTVLVFSPHPGRIVATHQASHVRQFLAGQDAGDIKSSPDFLRTRAAIRQTIHAGGVPA